MHSPGYYVKKCFDGLADVFVLGLNFLNAPLSRQSRSGLRKCGGIYWLCYDSTKGPGALIEENGQSLR